jgi:hypothetical protein
VKLRALREDLDAVRGRIDELRGRRTPQVVASLVRRKPGAAGVATQARAGTPAPARKARRR